MYDMPWFVYIIQCRDRTLYAGVAKDVNKRVKEHNTTNRCRYTRSRKPVVLMYQESCENYNKARKREAQIKKFDRKKKLDLIKRR